MWFIALAALGHACSVELSERSRALAGRGRAGECARGAQSSALQRLDGVSGGLEVAPQVWEAVVT